MEQPIFCVALPPEEALAYRMRAYHRNRVAEIVKGCTPFPMAEGAKLILHLIPDQSFASPTEFSADALGKAAKHSQPLGSSYSSSRYNADGFAIASLSGVKGYVQVFRNGTVETVMGDIVRKAQEPHQSNLLNALPIARLLKDGLPQYLRIFTALDVAPPVRCHLSLTGVKDCRILRGGEPSDHAIDRDIVEMPSGTATALDVAGHVVLRPLLDVMWNSAGSPQCPYFNAMGLWEEPRHG